LKYACEILWESNDDDDTCENTISEFLPFSTFNWCHYSC